MGYNTAISGVRGITSIDLLGPDGNQDEAVVESDLPLMTASRGA
jgi:hypothetical protein